MATNSENIPATGADTLIDILGEAEEHGYGTQQIGRPGERIECTGS